MYQRLQNFGHQISDGVATRSGQSLQVHQTWTPGEGQKHTSNSGSHHDSGKVLVTNQDDYMKYFRISRLAVLFLSTAIGACQSAYSPPKVEGVPLTMVLHQLDRELNGIGVVLYLLNDWRNDPETSSFHLQKLEEQTALLAELDVPQEAFPELILSLQEASKKAAQLREPACHNPDEDWPRDEYEIFFPDGIRLISISMKLHTISSRKLQGKIEVPVAGSLSAKTSRTEINTTALEVLAEPKPPLFQFVSWSDELARAERKLLKNPDDDEAKSVKGSLLELSPLASEVTCAILAAFEPYNSFVPSRASISVSFQVQKNQSAGGGVDIKVVSGTSEFEIGTDRLNQFVVEVGFIPKE